jgi:hypothetical protein
VFQHTHTHPHTPTHTLPCLSTHTRAPVVTMAAVTVAGSK